LELFSEAAAADKEGGGKEEAALFEFTLFEFTLFEFTFAFTFEFTFEFAFELAFAFALTSLSSTPVNDAKTSFSFVRVKGSMLTAQSSKSMVGVLIPSSRALFIGIGDDDDVSISSRRLLLCRVVFIIFILIIIIIININININNFIIFVGTSKEQYLLTYGRLTCRT